MAERTNALVLKTSGLHGPGGSNPPPSATVDSMSRKIRTAEELEKMSPAEIDAEFRAERILNRSDRTESLDQP